jgi:hypothetical protein
MGILLPPVSQVTNTRINMTQHHRNRSLDSALQRIPEVTTNNFLLPINFYWVSEHRRRALQTIMFIDAVQRHDID